MKTTEKAKQLYFEGDIVFTFWNKQGFKCSIVKTEDCTIKKQGIIQKVTYREERNTYSLNVKHESGFYLCEQKYVIHVDNHPDRVYQII